MEDSETDRNVFQLNWIFLYRGKVQEGIIYVEILSSLK